MDVSSISPRTSSIDYAGLPPVLLAASSRQAGDRAAAAIEAAGLRIVQLTIDEAPDRIGLQAAASALWVEGRVVFPPDTPLAEWFDASATWKQVYLDGTAAVWVRR